MKIITRYILRQVLFYFVASSLTIVGLGVAGLISQVTITQGLPLYAAARLTPYVLPQVGMIAIPVSILLAVSLTFGKLAGSNELIALKAMGVSPWKLFYPTWIFALIVSVFAVWVNDVAYSWGFTKMSEAIVEGAESMLIGKLASDGRFSDPDGNVTLSVSGVMPDGTLVQPSFSGKRFPGDGSAEYGRLTVLHDQEVPMMRIQLTNVIYKNAKGLGLFPQPMTFDLPLDQFGLSIDEGDPSLADIPKVIRGIEAEKQSARRKLAAQAVFSLAAGDPQVAGSSRWVELRDLEYQLDRQIIRCKLGRPRRFSSGFSCFFFAWVGIPVAIWLNRSEPFICFFACFVPILMTYYPLFMAGLNAAKEGTLPSSACWAGNAALGIAGYVLLRRIHRY